MDLYYGRVDVSHPHSEHLQEADMTGYDVLPNMTNEEMKPKADIPDDPDDGWFDKLDDIGKLAHLASRGSRSAAVHLRKHYSEGPFEDPRLAYKFACYAALSGDKESIESLRSEGKLVSTFFPGDLDSEWIHCPIDHSRPLEDLGHAVLIPVEPRAPTRPWDPAMNIGYRHPDSFGKYEERVIDFIRPEDLADGVENPSTRGYMFSERYWPDYYEMENWLDAEPFGEEYDEIDARFFRDVFQYFGIGTARDEDAAIRDLLDMALQGNRNAADMISYAIGYEPETFLARFPDRTAEEEAKHISDRSADDPRRMFYEVADERMLGESPEWRILMMLAHIDPWGCCDDPEHENDEGGYEDDVMFTRPDDQYNPGPPTFVFKPSGYSMGWYKISWRSAEQSENLSIGEIRRVFRLCVEHLAYGREIPEGPTKELISAPMRLYEPPEDIREDLERVARGAMTNRIGWVCTSWSRTYFDWNAEEAEKLALEILSGMSEE